MTTVSDRTELSAPLFPCPPVPDSDLDNDSIGPGVVFVAERVHAAARSV